MYLAIILETVSKILCFGLQRQDQKRFAVFYKVKEDEVLEGHVISIHKVFSELDCLHKCLIHYKCMSLNFQLQSSHSRHACELNDVTRALSGHPLKIRNGFSYWEPILPQQEVLDPKSFLQQEQSTLLVIPLKATTALMVTSAPTLATSSLPAMTSLQPSISSNNVVSSSSVQQAEIDCGANWHRYRTGCVRLFTESKTRQNARNRCKSFQTSGSVNGDLVKIMSLDDNNKIVSLSSEQGRYFIGLGDMNVEGVYKWPGGVDSPYKNWAQSHPQSGPDCVVINLSHASDLNNGKWMSENCQNNYRFICECPGACS